MEPALAPYKQQWQNAFSRNVRSRHFSTMKEYEDFVKSMPGYNEHIEGWVKDEAVKWMPKSLKKKLASVQEAKTQASQISKMKQMQAKADEAGLRVEFNSKGEPMFKSRNPDKEALLELQLERGKQNMDLHKKMTDLRMKQLEQKLKQYEAMYPELNQTQTEGQGQSGGEGSEPTDSQGKQITPEIAQAFVRQAGGDKNMARQMAKQAGYNF